MLNKQVLRVGKTLGYMRNKQVLRIEKPLGYMLNKQVLRVKKSTNHALKTQVYELNTAFLLTTFTPSTTQTAPKPLPLNRKHVSRQAHPLLRRGLGRLPLRTCSPFSIPPYPLTSPPSEGLGEAPSLWFLGSLLWCVLFVFCQLLSFFLSHLRPFAF